MKNKIISFVDKINDFFYYHQYGIKNLIKWFKTIYNDQHVDEPYIEKIIYNKLQIMYKIFRDNVDCQESQKIARQIKACMKLLCKIMYKDLEYDNIFFKKFAQKWNFYIQDNYQDPTVKFSNYNGEILTGDRYIPCTSVQDIRLPSDFPYAEYEKERLEVSEKSEKYKSDQSKALFLILHKCRRTWWT